MISRFLCLALVGSLLFFQVDAYAQLAAYQSSAELTGKVVSVGSDTLRIVVERWAELYRQFHSGVAVSIASKGSATAPAALTQGKSQLAPMSRKMTEDEVAGFEAKYGYKPLMIKVAIDALAVYVHKDNPIRGISLRELDGIFSKAQKCGGRNITKWGKMVYGPLSSQPIKLFGRNTLSGTHAVFREIALCGGVFKDAVTEVADSKAVVEAVGADPSAIGYSGLGYRTADVRPISIARNPDGPYYPFFVEKFKDDPNFEKRYEYVVTGAYPLARHLYVYVNKIPGEKLPVNVEAFLRLSLSAQGQKLVHEIGYIPLREKAVSRQLKKLSPDYKPSWWRFEN